jgi:hypothetical protein
MCACSGPINFLATFSSLFGNVQLGGEEESFPGRFQSSLVIKASFMVGLLGFDI